MSRPTIGFVGAGRMAQALARGFVQAGALSAADLLAFDPSSESCAAFSAAAPGARLASSNAELAKKSRLIFLAVKPQSLVAACAELPGGSEAETLYVSIVAGATLSRLGQLIGSNRVIRVMPNTPCLVGQGAAAICATASVAAGELKEVRTLLESVARVVQVDEHWLDAVTGLSGSGPAFVFAFLEAMADGGVAAGLPRREAMLLAAQTIKGAAEMVLRTGQHPGQLKDEVASPAGTTMAGLRVLEQRGFRGAVLEAVVAAARRAAELAGEVEGA